MTYLIIKALLTGVIVVLVSEVSKKSSVMGGLIASLPLTSILAMIWLYLDTGSADQVRSLSNSIFWMVLPSLFFFLALPYLLKSGMRFHFALPLACITMAMVYWGYFKILNRFGIT